MEIPLSSIAEVTYEALRRVAGAACGSNFSFLPYAPSLCARQLSFAAGTPEDHDLQAISSEPDAAKKLAMYQDFVQKYSSNPAPWFMATGKFRRPTRAQLT